MIKVKFREKTTNLVLSCEQAIKYVRERTDPIILSFSCGKDSIAAWLRLRNIFPRIIPVYLYLVPGLEFVEKSLTYYEDFFETRIYRAPNPNLYRMLNELVFQPPHHCDIIERAMLPNFTRDDVMRFVGAEFGIIDPFVAVGNRATDNLARMACAKVTGALNFKRKTFYTVLDYRLADVVAEISNAKCRLPVDYRLFGRTFDGICWEYLKPIKDTFPEDYARILEFFPLAELEMFRQEVVTNG